jgi:flagellar biosynthetic protein FliR
MEIFTTFALAQVANVLLLATRFTALFLMTPVLYAIPLPASVRLLLVLGLSTALAWPMSASGVPVQDLGALIAAFMQELAIGATLGLGVLMAFAGFNLAGRLIDVQVGFGMAQVLDPLTRRNVPVLTSVFSVVGVLLFFLVNGHHALLRGVAFSLERFPLGAAWSVQDAAGPVLAQAAGLFTLGFALAAPVVLCLLLVEFALGVIARNLPQVNMLVLGIPVKIVAGLVALSFWAAAMGDVTLRIYADIYRNWTAVMAPPSGAR